jgi:hypothetical protein
MHAAVGLTLPAIPPAAPCTIQVHDSLLNAERTQTFEALTGAGAVRVFERDVHEEQERIGKYYMYGICMYMYVWYVWYVQEAHVHVWCAQEAHLHWDKRWGGPESEIVHACMHACMCEQTVSSISIVAAQ